PKLASFYRRDRIHLGSGPRGHFGPRTVLSMPTKRSTQCAPKSPHCPSCAQTMRLAGITSRFDELPDLYKFECRGCGVSHIEPALSALKLDAIKDNQLSEKSSLPTLFGKLDTLEGSHLLRAFRKRRRVH